jgi:hypothetical protein
MTPYVKSMIEEFPDKLSGKTMTPCLEWESTQGWLNIKAPWSQKSQAVPYICDERNVPL